MKARHRFAGLVVAIAEASHALLTREERQHPGLERLKSLEGRWVGPAVWDQPRMMLEPSSDAEDLKFRGLGGTNMTEADSHMHFVRITLINTDHIRGEWSSVRGDVVEGDAQADLERRKSRSGSSVCLATHPRERLCPSGRNSGPRNSRE